VLLINSLPEVMLYTYKLGTAIIPGGIQFSFSISGVIGSCSQVLDCEELMVLPKLPTEHSSNYTDIWRQNKCGLNYIAFRVEEVEQLLSRGDCL